MRALEKIGGFFPFEMTDEQAVEGYRLALRMVPHGENGMKLASVRKGGRPAKNSAVERTLTMAKKRAKDG
jgi:hypothetical protein